MGRKKLILISKQTLQRHALAHLLSAFTGYKAIEEYRFWPEVAFRQDHTEICLYLADAELPDSQLNELMLFARKHRDKVAIIGSSYNKERLLDLLPLKADAYLTLDSSQEEFIKQLERIELDERVIADTLIPLMLDKLSDSLDEKNTVHTYSSLTAREKQILNFLAAGYTNNQIAEELVISVYTVKNHVHNVLDKLGFENRTQLVSFAFAGGFVG